MTKYGKLLIAALLGAALMGATRAATLCVANTLPNDNSRCISIEHLESKIDQWQESCLSSKESLQINFQEGIHRLSAPIRIRHLSCPGKLTLIGLGNGAVINGAQSIEFKADSSVPSKNSGQVIYSSPIPAWLKSAPPLDRRFGKSSAEPTELFRGSQAISVSRFPTRGYARFVNAQLSQDGLILREGELSRRYAGERDLRLGGYLQNDWADEIIPVSTVEVSLGRITLRRKTEYGVRADGRYFIENSKVDLQETGGWMIDRDSGKIYLSAQSDQNQTQVLEASVAQSALEIRNSSNISIRNLLIEKTRGDGLLIDNASDISINNITVRLTGSAGIRASGSRISIEAANIYDVGEFGISLKGPSTLDSQSSGNQISNSNISRVGRRISSYKPAIELGGSGVKVLRNTLREGPHAGIIFHGNNHLIEENIITGFAAGTGDVGFVYTGRSWTERGTRIHRNYLSSPEQGLAGGAGIRLIYLDDQASGSLISENILVGGRYGVYIAGGKDNVVSGNYFIEQPVGIGMDSRGLGWQSKLSERLLLEYQKSDPAEYSKRYANASKIASDEPGRPVGNRVSGNRINSIRPYEIDPHARAHLAWEDNFEVSKLLDPKPKSPKDIPAAIALLEGSPRGNPIKIQSP